MEETRPEGAEEGGARPRVSEHPSQHPEVEAAALLLETVGLYLHSSGRRLRRDRQEETVHPRELREEQYPEWAAPTDDIYLKDLM